MRGDRDRPPWEHDPRREFLRQRRENRIQLAMIGTAVVIVAGVVLIFPHIALTFALLAFALLTVVWLLGRVPHALRALFAAVAGVISWLRSSGIEEAERTAESTAKAINRAGEGLDRAETRAVESAKQTAGRIERAREAIETDDDERT